MVLTFDPLWFNILLLLIIVSILENAVINIIIFIINMCYIYFKNWLFGVYINFVKYVVIYKDFNLSKYFVIARLKRIFWPTSCRNIHNMSTQQNLYLKTL
jgi:hypothetical protein